MLQLPATERLILDIRAQCNAKPAGVRSIRRQPVMEFARGPDEQMVTTKPATKAKARTSVRAFGNLGG
jgi:hypothetical protein